MRACALTEQMYWRLSVEVFPHILPGLTEIPSLARVIWVVRSAVWATDTPKKTAVSHRARTTGGCLGDWGGSAAGRDQAARPPAKRWPTARTRDSGPLWEAVVRVPARSFSIGQSGR
jgi:hypothetical protein